jgi:hypothetical protein
MIQFSTCNQARNQMVILVLKMILMKMIATILMRRRNQVFFAIFINYSSHKNYSSHSRGEGFPLDLKMKRENQRTEDDISVVASDIKEERSQPSFSNNGRSGILPFVSNIKHEKGYLAFKLYFFNGMQELFF